MKSSRHVERDARDPRIPPEEGPICPAGLQREIGNYSPSNLLDVLINKIEVLGIIDASTLIRLKG